MSVWFALIFYIFIRFWYIRYNICSPDCGELLRVSRKSGWRKPHFTWECKLICPCFPVVFPIWMKVGIAYVHIMLLRIFELHKNQPREDCTFIMGLGEVNLRCLEIQARPVKLTVYNWRSCSVVHITTRFVKDDFSTRLIMWCLNTHI